MKKEIRKIANPMSPLPVALISCNTVEQPQVLTVSWTGVVNSTPLKVYVSVQPVRNSYAAIKERGEFVINVPTADMLKETDFCGTNSGRNVDKFKECGLTAEKCEHISAPMIAECPVSIECRVCEVLSLGSHDMFIADVLAVHVDPEMMNGDSIDFSKISTIAYGNSAYFKVEEKLGGFGIWKQL